MILDRHSSLTDRDPLEDAQSFRVTHIFHPLYGQEFTVVDSRSAWGEDRVYFRDATGWLRHLPTAWTSAAPRDPVVEMSAGRSHFRLEDLVQLTVLIARQVQGRRNGGDPPPR
jgi:hypothetical protein